MKLIPTLTGLLLATSLAYPQTPAASASDVETSLNRLAETAAATQYSIVLRFLPSFHPAEQLILSYQDDSSAYVEIRLASEAGMQSRKQKVSVEKMKDWLRSGISAASSTNAALASRTLGRLGSRGVMVTLDGTQYQCRFALGEDEMSFRLSGSELDTGDADVDVPIIRWMNRVRSEVRKLAAGPR